MKHEIKYKGQKFLFREFNSLTGEGLKWLEVENNLYLQVINS